MTDDIKEEVIEAVQGYVLMGFDNKEEIHESILNMFYDEDDFDEDWLKTIIDDWYDKHQIASLQWEKPTDFDKLVTAFDFSINNKIVCIQWAGPTTQDGEHNCKELIAELKKKGITAVGYCYYHMQDLEHAIEPESRNLYLGFDSATQDDSEALFVGNLICKALAQNGFKYVWDGDVEERIRIENINWQKVPDDEDYGKQRVLKMPLKP